jgi:hypothetical protein
MQGKCKKTGADAVAEVTPRRPANKGSSLPESALPESLTTEA